MHWSSVFVRFGDCSSLSKASITSNKDRFLFLFPGAVIFGVSGRASVDMISSLTFSSEEVFDLDVVGCC